MTEDADQRALDRRTIATRLTAERKRRKWTKPEIARRIRDSLPDRQCPDTDTLLSYVKRWEAGKVGVSERYRVAYAIVFGVDEDDLFALDGEDSDINLNQSVAPLPFGFPAASVDSKPTVGSQDDMERRRLLQTALTMGIGAMASSGESVRQLLDLAMDTETRSIEDWGMTCVDHLHALRTLPPAQVRDGLTPDLLALQRQMTTASAKVLPDLHLNLALLGFLQANAVTRLGDHGAAIRWWRTAKTAADASGVLDARLMIRCKEAGFGVFGQRPLPTVLRLVEKARRLAGDGHPFWTANLAGVEANALSLLGRHDEARRSLRTFVDRDGKDFRTDIFPTLWTTDALHFTESCVYASAGDESKADTARDLVLSQSSEYQYEANVRLHEGLCTVVQGGSDAGARQATAVLTTLPVPYRSQMITQTGRWVLDAIPPAHRDSSPVAELREALVLTAPN
ncbi:helix-turn-helix domain-containing protein [Actinomadura fibrosa]|uniref:Helix-turn-helix domain-containing protein n=1 Tax=Actinomadura fibrosa TaxID=111802 RepID=A0ABW2XL46_9ACTN|nr:helix-turn-helix transcriptional regulator [Actinomadura fibrosa]